MIALYVLLQGIAVVLMAANCWAPALIVAGTALMLAFRGRIKRWIVALLPFRAPRPYRTSA